MSSLGAGAKLHWDLLTREARRRRANCTRFAPYTVYELAEIPFESQIPKKADLRQMGRWQQIGVYAAGLALEDARLKDDANRLAATDLIVAAGNGERDEAADASVLAAVKASPADRAVLMQALQTSLRPTLYLAELSNLLAGNISIVHGVTKSSRTFKGEERGGLAAFGAEVDRFPGGASRAALVGAACNAERSDLHLSLELCGCLWHGNETPIGRRSTAGGGIVLGSIGSFVVLEEADHARSRQVRPYARVTAVVSARMHLAAQLADDAAPSELCPLQNLIDELSSSPADVLSGASGVQSAMEREMAFIHPLMQRNFLQKIRYYGDALGHGMEAHFPTGIALAALSLSNRFFYPAFDGDNISHRLEPARSNRILVTGFGSWRGAGVALLEQIEVTT